MAKTGIEIIAEERQRQIEKDGWSPEHDDEHKDYELSKAAQQYTHTAILVGKGFKLNRRGIPVPYGWPWNREWWKPSEDPIRNLAKAGALIAAEIDRLQRKNG